MSAKDIIVGVLIGVNIVANSLIIYASGNILPSNEGNTTNTTNYNLEYFIYDKNISNINNISFNKSEIKKFDVFPTYGIADATRFFKKAHKGLYFLPIFAFLLIAFLFFSYFVAEEPGGWNPLQGIQGAMSGSGPAGAGICLAVVLFFVLILILYLAAAIGKKISRIAGALLHMIFLLICLILGVVQGNKDGIRKCFIYVYETEGSTLLLGNAKEELFDELKDKGKVVSKSLFPKSKDLWITIPIDSSYTVNEVNYVIDSLYGCHIGLNAELSNSVEGERKVARSLSEIEIKKEVTVEEASELVSDEVVEEALEIKYVKLEGGKKTIINIDTISENYKDGDEVNIKSLKEKGLIQSKYSSYKVLARGILNKKLKVVADDFSNEAIKMIILTGGEVVELKEKK